MKKVKILFLAANPAAVQSSRHGDAKRDLHASVGPSLLHLLELDREFVKVYEAVQKSEYGHELELIPRFDVKPDDLQQVLLEVRPEVVHFSGHGTNTSELIFVDERGNPKSEAIR